MEQAKIVKFCLVGAQSVGKTSILHQFIHKKYDNKIKSTIGCDFSIKKLSSDGLVNLQVWDIAGQQRFMGVSKTYFRGALGFIVVCSSIDARSIEEAIKWKNLIKQSIDSEPNQNIPILLLQNKCDLIDEANPSQIQSDRYLQQVVSRHQFCNFMKCSAKQNTNIEEPFEYLLEQVNKRGLIKRQQWTRPCAKKKSFSLIYSSSIHSEKNKRSDCCS